MEGQDKYRLETLRDARGMLHVVSSIFPARRPARWSSRSSKHLTRSFETLLHTFLVYPWRVYVSLTPTSNSIRDKSCILVVETPSRSATSPRRATDLHFVYLCLGCMPSRHHIAWPCLARQTFSTIGAAPIIYVPGIRAKLSCGTRNFLKLARSLRR